MSKKSVATGLFSLVLLACGGSTPHSEGASGSVDPSTGSEAGTLGDAAPPTFDEQASAGAQLYGRHCASCHGAGGEGTGEAPPLVGFDRGALPLAPRAGSQRTSQFITVGDVAAFAVATMPPGSAGRLTAEEYWAILAFDLVANGIHLDEELTPERAAELTIPR